MNLMNEITKNLGHAGGFLGTVVGMFLLAFIAEKLLNRRETAGKKILSTRKITVIGLFSAISAILMLFEFPLPFLALPFYELDFSEIPVMICAFAYGPVAGVFVEFCKILLKLLFKSTSTAFVGELANFAVGCSLILPAAIIYRLKKTKKMAIIACSVGTVSIGLFGAFFNALYLLPAFAVLYMQDAAAVDSFVQMGHQINPMINSIWGLAMFSVFPLNLIKGAMVTGITAAVYKPLSPILKESHRENAKDVKNKESIVQNPTEK